MSPKGDRSRASEKDSANAGTTADNNVSESDRSSSTPPTTSSFIGQQSSGTTCHYFLVGCNPPDMALAASPNFVLQGVNTQWEGNIWFASQYANALQAGPPQNGRNWGTWIGAIAAS